MTKKQWIDPQLQFRKRFWVVLLLTGLGFIPLGLFAVNAAFQQYAQVAANEPVIRLGSGLIGNVTLPIFGVYGVIVSVLHLLNQPVLYARFMERIGVRMAVISLAIGVVLLVAAPITARIVMPLQGYSACSALQGGLNLYHTYWLRNPEWCVRGKSLEWARAMAAREAGADIDPDNLPPEPERRSYPGELLWMFLGLMVGSGFWINQMRHDRQRGVVMRWLVAVGGGLVIGFFCSVVTLLALWTSGGRHWVALLALLAAVAYPLSELYDRWQARKAQRPPDVLGHSGWW